ncbi:hypothetical protein PoB_003605800 [Plakobranchus ocellatus]|uniref:Uncharacterized protein n=1 Tax=Plakobranchus ocellatus TaxID=259542 RepID=A0AAV4ASK7_9GAST|nr:hypothetical protein PoB_003605800 [Plakobranchus ocellatus]
MSHPHNSRGVNTYRLSETQISTPWENYKLLLLCSASLFLCPHYSPCPLKMKRKVTCRKGSFCCRRHLWLPVLLPAQQSSMDRKTGLDSLTRAN